MGRLFFGLFLLGFAACAPARPATTSVDVVTSPPEGTEYVGFMVHTGREDCERVAAEVGKKKGADFAVITHPLGGCRAQYYAAKGDPFGGGAGSQPPP